MSFSRGGQTASNTTNEQNPITATDSAVIANEGSTIQITDGGAFDLVSNVTRDVIDSNSNNTNNALLTGLHFFDGAIGAVQKASSDTMGALAQTTQQLFDSQKSDDLNQSENLQETIITGLKWVVVGASVYSIAKYVFK